MAGRKRTSGTLFDRLAPFLGVSLIIVSVFIGGATGLAAVCFIRLINFIQHFFYHNLSGFMAVGWAFVALPVIGGLLVGPLVTKFAKEAKGHGVPEVMRAMIMNGGRIRARVALVKIAASALCIGSGGSAGREGPIVQAGSALGSAIGQLARLSDERIKNLLSCGAAAGIAATFNAPIAGVAFAVEVLMSELRVRMFGDVVMAAVSGAIVSQAFLGDHPAFSVPDYSMESPHAIVLYLVLGVVAALVGIMFIRMLGWFEVWFDKWRFPEMLKPAVGALLLGIVGWFSLFFSGPGAGSVLQYQHEAARHVESMPLVYGSGFPVVEAALQGRLDFWLMAALVFLKPLATSCTLGSGNSGGVFAPSLFVGAMLGGAMGKIYCFWFPDIAGDPGAYALVGMSAVFAAAARAPLTSMLIVFEMSNDYSMILPLMATAVTACYVAQGLWPESIYSTKLTRLGIRFKLGRDMDVMQGVLVEEVMRRDPICVSRDLPLSELDKMFHDNRLLGFPVLDAGGDLHGIVTLQDLQQVLAGDEGNVLLAKLRVDDIVVTDVVTVYPDEPIWTAIQKMAPRDLARLPVIGRGREAQFLGIISRSDILRAYELAIVRKQRGQMLDNSVALRVQLENKFYEFQLGAADMAVGMKLRNMNIPEHVNVVSVQRGARTIIPKGNTTFFAGDIVTLYGRSEFMDQVLTIFVKGKME